MQTLTAYTVMTTIALAITALYLRDDDTRERIARRIPGGNDKSVYRAAILACLTMPPVVIAAAILDGWRMLRYALAVRALYVATRFAAYCTALIKRHESGKRKQVALALFALSVALVTIASGALPRDKET